jgi:hypothetical protein
MRAIAAGLVVVTLLAGATALAGDGLARGAKHLGLRACWSLLTAEQKAEAKEILAEHLAATAPDRLVALARVVKFKAEVAAVLTPEQRVQAGKLGWAVRRLPRERKVALLDELLDGTDRTALADRVESLDAAAPADRVKLGLAILDQVVEVLTPKLVEKLALTAEQVEGIRTLYAEAKADLEPVAVRLAKARALAVRRGLSILTGEQRARLTERKEGFLSKVVAFLRG